MSVVAITCPTCGSPATSTVNANEYVCTHCHTRFQITHPSATLISDTRAHHCPICGRPVQATQSYRCTECGRVDVCDRCVTAVRSRDSERFACRTCIAAKGWSCSECGNFAETVCVVCKRRACQTHLERHFGLRVGNDVRIFHALCLTCNGRLCNSCAEVKRGYFSSKVYCRKCRNEVTLDLSQQQSSSCSFCGTLLRAGVRFCSLCGKAQT